MSMADSSSRIRVLFFGAAADRAGVREAEIPAEEAGTLEELWRDIARRYPELLPMRDNLAFAVNQNYARMEDLVSPGDEVAVLPPVSGG